MAEVVNQHLKKTKTLSELLESKEYTVPFNQSISIADELRKLAKLKEEEKY
jgi:uncharacterized protein (UPF0216 family)